MLGAGTIINPIIKIVTTVAILAAIYFFLVKPVLDTTNDPFEQFGFGSLSETLDDLPTGVQDQIDSALDQSSRSEATALGECISRVQPDQAKIQRCLDRF